MPGQASLWLVPRHAHNFLRPVFFEQQWRIVRSQAEPVRIEPSESESIQACKLLNFSSYGHTRDGCGLREERGNKQSGRRATTKGNR